MPTVRHSQYGDARCPTCEGEAEEGRPPPHLPNAPVEESDGRELHQPGYEEVEVRVAREVVGVEGQAVVREGVHNPAERVLATYRIELKSFK